MEEENTEPERIEESNKDESTPVAKIKKEKKNRKAEEGSDKKDNSGVTGRWNKEEHDKFIDAIKQYGKDWKQVEQHIESRTGAQIRSHAQKFFNRIIKRYNIEKNEVIDFVHNAYNSNIDSSIQSPKRKKKSEASSKNTKNLYVFNEEPNIKSTKEEGEKSRAEEKQETLSRDLDYSVLSLREMTEAANRPGMLSWKEHIKIVAGYGQDLLSELDKENIAADEEKILRYKPFLLSMSTKLDLLGSSEIVKFARPKLSSDDNICTSFGKSDKAGEHEDHRADESYLDEHYLTQAEAFIGKRKKSDVSYREP
jgi:SHAQKYF class myb-like DNA-binding protein